MGILVKTDFTSRRRLLQVALFLFILLMSVYSVNAQATQARMSSTKIEHNLVSSTQSNQQAKDELTNVEIHEKIKLIQDHLLAIESKRNWINEDPQRIQEAKENNWFEQVGATEKALLEKRSELITLLKKDKE